MSRVRVAEANSLADGQTLKFQFSKNGRPMEGFLARFAGQLVAYENVCRHIPISLDYGDGRFFTRDGKNFICQSHGALYEPLSGKCIGGPCLGEKLKALPVEEAEGAIWLLGVS